MIKMPDGSAKTFPVRTFARSEVAAMPFDTEGLFLIDETNKIASATLTRDIVAEDDSARSTAYNVDRHMAGVVQDIPENQSVTIQATDNQIVSLPIWDYLEDEMAKISKGMQITLLVDRDDKVVDISFLLEELN